MCLRVACWWWGQGIFFGLREAKLGIISKVEKINFTARVTGDHLDLAMATTPKGGKRMSERRRTDAGQTGGRARDGDRGRTARGRME